MLINIQHLSGEARIKILEVLGKDDRAHVGALVEDDEEELETVSLEDEEEFNDEEDEEDDY